VVIPLPTATDDHQRKNAEALAVAGAADLLLQRDLTVRCWRHECWRWPPIAAGGIGWRRPARTLARPEAARVIVDRALELAGARR